MPQNGKRRIHSDALSIGELLRKPLVYRVPYYQRDFAWTAEEIDVLWEDLTASLLGGRSEYFLGAIVTSPRKDDKSREIVDGQQRLAALSMIFACIAAEWRTRGDINRASGVTRDFLGSEDRRTGEVIAKLTLNETNNATYQSLVLDGKKPTENERRAWPRSNKLLADAFARLRDKVHKWISEFSDPADRLLDLEDFLATNTNIILIEVGDESDAFVIFETLNDRGLDLAVSDLVKNYLFSLAGPHIDRYKQVWAEMSLLLGAENLTPFLRHFWLSEYEVVRERDLYRTLKRTVKNQTASRQIIERLRRVADLYAALLNPEHVYWSDFGPEVRAHLDALILFKVTQFRPVMLAAMDTLVPDNIAKILRMLMVISFRYTVISALGTGNLEAIYSDAATAIRTGQAKTPAKVFNILKSAYVADDRFTEEFAGRLFGKPPIARYTLAEINDHMEQDPERMVAERTGRITLEHILPRNPGKQWKGSFRKGEDPNEYMERIGNLTLLEKGGNRGIANLGFQQKKDKAFGRSSLAINRELMRCEEWGSSEIEERSRRFAKIAAQIWRVGYETK